MSTPALEHSLTQWSRIFHAAGGLISLSLLGAVALLALRPLELRESQLQLRSEAIHSELSIAEAVRLEHEQLSSEIARVEDKIEQLLNRIPNVPRESDFLGQITTLAEQVGLAIIDYRPGSVSDAGQYKQMSLTLSSTGSYEAICRFLHEIQQLPRLSRVLKTISR
jgi:Tfp pilus assembly protein PilO